MHEVPVPVTTSKSGRYAVGQQLRRDLIAADHDVAQYYVWGAPTHDVVYDSLSILTCKLKLSDEAIGELINYLQAFT